MGKGNLFPLHALKSPCIRLPICGNRKVLQVVKTDGKIIRFTGPIPVKELLMNFEGFAVKSSKKSTKHLPPSFELKLGRTYYLFPSKASDQTKTQPAATVEAEPNTASVERIKVVITKKQLQELLSKKTSAENLVLRMDKAFPVNPAANWKPSLAAIPEEDESNAVYHT